MVIKTMFSDFYGALKMSIDDSTTTESSGSNGVSEIKPADIF